MDSKLTLLFQCGWIRKTISAYDMVLRLKPDYTEAYHNQGTAKTLIAEYYAAITDFDETIRLKSEFVETYYNPSCYGQDFRHANTVFN